MRFSAPRASPADTIAAAASEISAHGGLLPGSRRRSRTQARAAHTMTIGATPVTRMRPSATCPQVSRRATASGRYQRAGSRSTASQASSTGTVLPK